MGHHLQILGTAQVGIRIGLELFSADLIIFECPTTDAIFGLDFLHANQCIIDTQSRQLQFADRNMKLPLNVTLNEAAAHVTALHLPPSSEIEVMAKVQERIPATSTWIVEGAVTTRMPIRVAHGLVHVRRGEVPVRLLNPSTEPIVIHKGTQIATMEQVHPAELSSIKIAMAAWEYLTQSKCSVREALFKGVDKVSQRPCPHLLLLLQEYRDVFAVNKDD